MLIALVAVVAAVAMAVLGESGPLRDADTDRLEDRLPADRPLVRSDIDAVRLPTAVRGYRMLDVDEVLDRLGAELAERDARIVELESSLEGVASNGTTMSLRKPEQPPAPAAGEPGHGYGYGVGGGAGE